MLYPLCIYHWNNIEQKQISSAMELDKSPYQLYRCSTKMLARGIVNAKHEKTNRMEE